VVRLARPRQWLKNILVVAAPVAAGVLFQRDIAVSVALTFVLFSLAASAVYMFNDVVDREADRAHPVKRRRPVASGMVSVPAALTTAAGLAGAAVSVPLAVGRWSLAVVLGVYLVTQVAYCVRLKHEPVFDIAVVSSGFLLRCIAGGAAAAVPISPWFLLVAAFGSLFMAAGKRYSELLLVGEGDPSTRRALEKYSATYLRFVWAVAAAVVIVFYCLWAVESGNGTGIAQLLAELSLVPFILAILRYAMGIDRGAAGEPESAVTGDVMLILLGVVCVVMVGARALIQ
jgi:decaprenyl-phosphate phosphoribosyltransferase